jgi:hypothetical protein
VSDLLYGPVAHDFATARWASGRAWRHAQLLSNGPALAITMHCEDRRRDTKEEEARMRFQLGVGLPGTLDHDLWDVTMPKDSIDNMKKMTMDYRCVSAAMHTYSNWM